MRLAIPFAVVLAIVVAPTSPVREPDLRQGGPPGPQGLVANELLRRVPFTFVENDGQWAEETRFLGRRGGGAAVRLERNAIILQLLRREPAPREETPFRKSRRFDRIEACEPILVASARFSFEGSTDAVRLVGRNGTPTLYNFFLGNDPARWRMGVRGYESVVYEGLYAGVDLLVREGSSSLEYDFLLAPGADLSAVAVRVQGAKGRLRLDEAGALVMTTPLGEVRQPRPRAWEVRGERGGVAVECSYRLLAGDRFGFEVAGRNEDFALVVDPQLLYSTYLGGNAFDSAVALALDSTGAAVVAGYTDSTDFPTQNAFQATSAGNTDVFVTRLPLSGGPPTYSTYLGGSGEDAAWALALDSTGEAVVTGSTSSPNFPTQNAYQATPGGVGTFDAFVTRLPVSGGPPSYSTYLGGTQDERAYGVALDSTGEAVVTGSTSSPNFPTQNAFQPMHGGGYRDVFVARLPLSGGLPSYSTYLGGSGDDVPQALALDSAGAAVVAGRTDSLNFPTQNAFEPTFSGGSYDTFLTRLPLSGGPPTYSTYLGGSQDDQAFALALDSTGAAVVAGATNSSDFPIQNAFQATFSVACTPSTCYPDAFVTRLPLSGGPPSYSTYLGGNARDQAMGLALDSTGAAVVAGETGSPNLPTVNAFQPTFGGGLADAFVIRLPLSGGPPPSSTYLGGNDLDYALAIALDPAGAVVVVGDTLSPNFPTQNGFQPTYTGGYYDAFVSHLDLVPPAGTSGYGASSPGCDGPLLIGATSIPQVGNAAFAVTCGNAPPSAGGSLALSGAALASPIVIAGVEVWVDGSSSFFLLVPVTSNPAGGAQVPIPIPAVPSLAGVQANLQFFWMGPNAPSPPCPALGISASNALEVTVQP